ncbi:MAG: hypothetical protein IT169_09350 [Bryobacterales bacterium]|nr:hypothetical protein [Bryobacterales bacterium]
MKSASIAISGFTTVLLLPGADARAADLPGTDAEALPAAITCSAMVAGPGVAMLAGMLARLGVPCAAQLESGVDAEGLWLRKVIESSFPNLSAHWRPAPSGHTARMVATSDFDSHLESTSSFSGSDFCFEDLPTRQPASRALGVWCYPAAGIGNSSAREDAFALRMAAARERGTTQVLLLGAPLAQREHGGAWQSWLRPLLACADVLCARADTLLETLDPVAAAELSRAGKLRDLPSWLTGGILHDMSGYLLDCGVGLTVLSLAGHGVYLRSNRDSSQLAFTRKFAPDDRFAAHLAEWTERDILIPPFQIDARNRYASADALCAGVVTSLVRGLIPEEAIRMTAAVMGFAAESADAVESMPSWDVARARVDGGWAQGRCGIDLSGWSDSQEG